MRGFFGSISACCGDDLIGVDRIVMTNLGTDTVILPPGEILASSVPLTGHELPADTAVWLRT